MVESLVESIRKTPSLQDSLKILFRFLNRGGVRGFYLSIEGADEISQIIYPSRQYELGEKVGEELYFKRALKHFNVQLTLFCDQPQKTAQMAEYNLGHLIEKLITSKILLEIERIQTLSWRTIFDSISSPHIIVDKEFNIIKLNQAAGNISAEGLKKSKNHKCYTLLAKRERPCTNCPINFQESQTITLDKKYLAHAFQLSQKEHWGVFYHSIEEELALLQQCISNYKLQELGKSFESHLTKMMSPLDEIENVFPKNLLKEDDGEKFQIALKRSFGVIQNMTNFLFPKEHKEVKETCVLQEQIKNSLQLSRPHLHNIKVNFNLSEKNVVVLGSSEVWIQILFNLIRNAYQAMPAGGTLTIELNEHHLKVSDTGSGISPGQIQKLFTPLFTTKEGRRGHGLGLFVVKKILDKLDYTILLHSELGKGSEFTISFSSKIKSL